MKLNEVVQQLKQERSRLDAAIQALEGSNRRGRSQGSAKRPTMSAAARRRISQAMKKRWAKRKKAKK